MVTTSELTDEEKKEVKKKGVGSLSGITEE